MIKRIFTVLIIFYSIAIFGQKIKIVDDETGFSISEVAIYNKNLTISTITNDKGFADISDFNQQDLLLISHVSYATYSIAFKELKTVNYLVKLTKKTAQLDEVVLSVFKKQEKSTRIAEQTVAITKEDILKESPQTSADLLAAVPGIKVQKSQFGGGSPVLRGMESNRVLLVVDGVRMNNAIYRKGHLQNSITISPSILERTEIVFGPSSVIYGSDALGGIIHYYTKTPKTSEKENIKTSFFSRLGTVNEEVTTSLSAELSFKKWASFTSFTKSLFGDLKMGKNRNHGFKDWGLVPFYSKNIAQNYFANPTINTDPNLQRNSGYEQTDFLQKLYIPLSQKSDLTFNLQYSTSSNIPRFDRLTELKSGTLKFAEWYYGPQERFLASTQLSINPEKKWLNSGTFTVSYQNIKESRVQRKFNDLKRLYRNEEVDVYSLNGDFSVPLANDKNRNLSYGFEVAYNDVKSSSEGKIIAPSSNKIVGLVGDFKVQSRFPDGGSSYTSSAVYTDYRQDINAKSTLNTGIRFTNTKLKASWIDQAFIALPNTAIELNNTALTATIGYVYKPTKDWKLNTVISSGFRSPNIDDVGKIREKNSDVTLPNVALKPEFAYNAEVGVLKFFNQRKFSVGFNTYYTLLDNYITRAANGNTIIYDGEVGNVVTNINKGTAYITGFTANYFGRLNNNFKTSGSVTYTKGKTLDTKEPMSSIPPLFGRFEISYRKNRIELSVDYRFNAKKDIKDYNISEGIDNHVQTPVIDANAAKILDKYYGTPSWQTFSLNAKYNVSPSLWIQGKLTNLFDEHYKEFASGVSAPGRNFSVALHAIF
ncbi:MAG: TonB-dependent receptor [Polaribacter sp.]|nr:TonB-dependent receptor [Polaribacter sp.]MDG1811797.1 TonB-dependent receptor [Polaribacter sp.]MDG1994658.1 TonB-dependent receptor [Polaribacter sp.]